jgi:prepilin-type N-terminal cleavage/methylation domain-containing protein
MRQGRAMQKRNLTGRQQGFTIVELILAVTLVAILTLAIYGAASAMRRSFTQNTLNNYNLLAAKKGLSRIADTLRYATGISLPTSGSATFADSVTVTVNGGGTTKIYLKDIPTGGKALIIGTNSIAEPLVKSLTFGKTSPACITVSMKVVDPSLPKLAANPELELSTTVRMLNVAPVSD